MGSTKAIALSGVQSVTRLGLAADVATAVVTNIFTVAGTVILISIFGRVVVQKEANAQLIQLQHIPTDSGVAVDLAAVSATTSGDDVDTFYMITGNIGDAMITAPAGLGVSNHMVNAAGLVGAPQGLLLATRYHNDGDNNSHRQLRAHQLDLFIQADSSHWRRCTCWYGWNNCSLKQLIKYIRKAVQYGSWSNNKIYLVKRGKDSAPGRGSG